MPESVPAEDDGSRQWFPTECINGHPFGPDMLIWSDVGGTNILCRVCGMEGSSPHGKAKWYWRQREVP
jgi:hypothetical protein